MANLARIDCGRASYLWRVRGVTPGVKCWLHLTPEVRAAITWQTAAGDLPFDQWSDAQKVELYLAYELTSQGGTVVTVDPPPNAQILEDSDYPLTVLNESHAWDLFISSLAHTLYLEINGVLGWSLLDYPAEVRARLLTSHTLFTYYAAYEGYVIAQPHGRTVPAPAERTYAFLQANDLIGTTRFDTISRVLEWCRATLRHFSGTTTAANFEAIWGYRGFPPTSTFFGGAQRYDTAGCHGTNGFLQDLFRAINIPVDYDIVGATFGHAAPHFLSEGLHLTHGDDIYNQLALGVPAPFPAASLLIDNDTFDAWLINPPDPADRQNNIGRQPYELALVHLPPYLLREHCSDLTAGRNHANSRVAALFDRFYTVADLESIDLWGRMDAALAVIGGCANVPVIV